MNKLAPARMPDEDGFMIGHSHALSGAVAGLAAAPLILHGAGRSASASSCRPRAAYALAPDLDDPARRVPQLGFVTEASPGSSARISGGHRHGTHSLAGVAAFTGGRALACLYRHDWAGRIALFLILAAGFAAASDALRIGGHAGDLLRSRGRPRRCAGRATGWRSSRSLLL